MMQYPIQIATKRRSTQNPKTNNPHNIKQNEKENAKTNHINVELGDEN
jgi:hypothetical protein